MVKVSIEDAEKYIPQSQVFEKFASFKVARSKDNLHDKPVILLQRCAISSSCSIHGSLGKNYF